MVDEPRYPHNPASPPPSSPPNPAAPKPPPQQQSPQPQQQNFTRTPQRPPWVREPEQPPQRTQQTTESESRKVFVQQAPHATQASRGFPTPAAAAPPPPPTPEQQQQPSPPQSPPPPFQTRVLEERMIALETNYARSAENFKESSLAMVKALEILESRIGAQTGQPLVGMGEGEIGKQISAMRSELAQLKNRIDGLLPPPRNYQASPPPPPPPPSDDRQPPFPPPPPSQFKPTPSYQQARSWTPPSSSPPPPPPQFKPTPSYQQARSWTPPRAAKIKRSAGRGFLSLLVTVFAIIVGWYIATYINSARERMVPQSFQKEFLNEKTLATQDMPPPKNSVDYFVEAEEFYRTYLRVKNEDMLIKAINYYQIASNEGMTAAVYRLGNFYEKGLGVVPDLAHAVQLYEQAARGGHVRAMHQLAMLYLEGRGVAYDIASASEWFLKAAGFGFADSMNQLGFVNEEGKIGTRNIIHAYAWYALAARLGHQSAAKQLPRLEISLSKRNKKEAEALVNSWRIREADPLVNGIIRTQHVSPRLTLNKKR